MEELLINNNLDNIFQLTNGGTVRLTSKDFMGLILGMIKGECPGFFVKNQFLAELQLQQSLATKVSTIWGSLKRKSKNGLIFLICILEDKLIWCFLLS